MPRGDAAAKARQRERNGSSGRGNSGSSGIAKRTAAMNRMEWEDVEHLVEHVCDIQGIFQSGTIMANRQVSGTIVSPKEFAHEMLDAAMASQGRAVFVRFYVVPLSAFDDPDDVVEDSP